MPELISSEKNKYSDSSKNAFRVIDQEGYPFGLRHTDNRPNIVPYVWNSNTLALEVATQLTINTGSLSVSSSTDLTKIGGVSVVAAARTQTPTGNVMQVQIGPGDPISNVPVMIDFPHHQIHEGEAYNYEYYDAAPSTISFAITVPVFSPTIRAPHLIIEAETYEGSGMITLWEGITFTGGDVGLIYNRNRNIVAANTTTIKSGVSITGAGVKLPYTMFFGAGKETRSTGGTRDQNEIVLKANTIYGIILEEVSAMTRVIMRLSWYEDLGV